MTIINEIYPNIFEFTDFIEAEDAKKIMNRLLSLKEFDWELNNIKANSTFKNKLIDTLAHESFVDDKNILFKYKEKAEKLFKQSHMDGFNYRFIGGSEITRIFDKGVPVHHDSGDGPVDKVSYGMIYYLNSDYDGGELFYPNLGLSIKPKANSLLIHPGAKEYEHGVKDVISGTRYCITLFAEREQF